jgi:hypothetical protein
MNTVCRLLASSALTLGIAAACSSDDSNNSNDNPNGKAGGAAGMINKGGSTGLGGSAGLGGSSATVAKGGAAGESNSGASGGKGGAAGGSSSSATGGKDNSGGASGSNATGGKGGSAGSAGASGSNATGGKGGSAGSAGASGSNATGGKGGSAGSAGASGSYATGGKGGSAGSAGASGSNATGGFGGVSGSTGIGGASGVAGNTNQNPSGFNIRIPQTRSVSCSGTPTDFDDMDWICSFSYQGKTATVYAQSNPTGCNVVLTEIATYTTVSAKIAVNGTVSDLQDAAYDWGGNHHNDSLAFTYEGTHFNYYHSSFGFGWRSCQNMDCLQVLDDAGAAKEDGCTSARTMPIVCSLIQPDGTYASLSVDTFAKCPGDNK